MSSVRLFLIFGWTALASDLIVDNEHLGILAAIFFCSAGICQEIKKLKK